jgi:SulP family sulfate permease
VGGFLAATGWLLFTGGVSVMVGQPVSLTTLPGLLQLPILWLWLPGVTFGALLVVLSRRFHHFLLLPALLVGGIILFYVFVWLTGVTLAQVVAQGWLLGGQPGGTLWKPVTPALLAVSFIALLMNASSIELLARRDVDLDKELRTAGLGNLLAGLLGGAPGYQSISFSALALRLGADSRWVGIIVSLVCFLTLVAGASFLTLIPKMILGGLLVYLGLGFLVEWLYDAARRLPLGEYLVVVLIAVTIALWGFLPGLALGVLASVVLFVIKYSKTDVVKQALSGATYRSNVDRGPSHEALLRSQGDQILMLRLQGYLFFGTADTLLKRVRARVHDLKSLPLRYLVLDFRLVHGMDASALNGFVRIQHMAEANGFEVVLSQLTPDMQRQFARVGLSGGAVREAPTVDQGMEWCEEDILHHERPEQESQSDHVVREELRALCPDAETFESLMAAFERLEMEAGTVLLRQGELSTEVYLVEAGQLNVMVEGEGGHVMRVRRIGPGTVVGEVGFYLAESRSATVVAAERLVVYRMEQTALRKLERESPAAVAFHQFMARSVAGRTASMNAPVRDLLA